MTDYRKILMLRSMGCSQREMERNKITSRETSKAVFETADRLGISWPLDDDITNADLERMLFPDKYKNVCLYDEPDYQYIHRELAKPGVTLTLLWEEYCNKCYEAKKKPYMSTQFGDKYRKWARRCASSTSPETLFKLTGPAIRFPSMILSQVNRAPPICL